MNNEQPDKPTFDELVEYLHRHRVWRTRQIDPVLFWHWAEARQWVNASGKPNRDWHRYVDGNSHQPGLRYANAKDKPWPSDVWSDGSMT